MQLKKYWEYTTTILLFLISGGAYFYMQKGSLFVPLYFFFTFLYAYKWGHLLKRNDSNIYILVYLIWSSVSFYIIYPTHSDSANQFYTIILMLIGTYCFFSNITLTRFKVLYLNVCTCLAFISIIVYFSSHLGLLPITIIKESLFTLFHVVGWIEISDRLFGIYWEPGVYQIVLNVTLFLYLNELANLAITKKQKIQFSIIITALLLTKSTAGYINLAILLILFILRSKKIRSNIFLLMSVCCFAIISIFYLYNSPVVQDKFAQQDKEGTSYEVRLADNLGMFTMITEEPLIGYGLSSKNYEKRADELGNLTSSNGILAMGAMFGLPFLFFYLYYMTKGIRRIVKGFISYLCLPVIILFHCTEVYFYFPIALIFILNFKKQVKHQILSN